MKKPEIRALADTYPDLAARAVAMERGAHRASAVAGLGRRFAWGDVIAGRETAPELPMSMPCDCYDGAEA